MYDTAYFKESPSIVRCDTSYYLRFRYAEGKDKWHFYMMTWSTIKGDSLVFYLPCTSSSGYCDGKLQFEGIEGKAKTDLAKKGKAYFLEPDKTYIPLAVEKIREEEVHLLRAGRVIR